MSKQVSRHAVLALATALSLIPSGKASAQAMSTGSSVDVVTGTDPEPIGFTTTLIIASTMIGVI